MSVLRSNPDDSIRFKLHKSCDYCRHRKIKCVRRAGFEECDHCRTCEVECTFSRKLPSKKRKLRSAKIVASLKGRVKREESIEDDSGGGGGGGRGEKGSSGGADTMNDIMRMSASPMTGISLSPINGNVGMSTSPMGGNMNMNMNMNTTTASDNTPTSTPISTMNSTIISDNINSNVNISNTINTSNGNTFNNHNNNSFTSISPISTIPAISPGNSVPNGISPSNSIPGISPSNSTNVDGWYYEPLYDLIYPSKSLDDSKYDNRNDSVSTTASHFESSPDTYSQEISVSKGHSENPVKDGYLLYIKPLSPFFLSTDFEYFNDKTSKLVNYCISLASFSSVACVAPPGSADILYDTINQLLIQQSFSDFEFSSIFCVLVKYKFPFDRVDRVIRMFQVRIGYNNDIEELEKYCNLLDNSHIHHQAHIESYPQIHPQTHSHSDSQAHTQSSPINSPIITTPSINYNLLLGFISCYAWNSFVCHDKLTPPPITNDSIIIKSYEIISKTLDEQTFSLHYFYVSTLLYRFTLLMPNEATTENWHSRRKKLIQFELELLLWPVKLPKNLTVVKDELIATNEALILHVLHNTVLIAYYCKAITYKDIYGRMLSILPVPGLLQFICGMASSSFKIKPEIIEKWPILKDCLLFTAKLILDLYRKTEYENCKVSLSFFNDSQSNPLLYKSIKDTLGAYTWSLNHEDGATLYWIFRDVRSMSLQHLY